MQYLYDDEYDTHREDIFMAQIAAEIRRGNVKYPKKVNIKDFLKPFMKPEKKISKKKMTKEEATAKSKAIWFNLVGYKDGSNS